MPADPMLEILHRHFRATLPRLVDQLQRIGVPDATLCATDALLEAAARTVSERSERPVPQVMNALDDEFIIGRHWRSNSQVRTALAPFVAAERDWITTNLETTTQYGSELLRMRGNSANVTSRTLARVTSAVLNGFPDLSERHEVSVLDPACGVGTLLLAARDALQSPKVGLFGQDVSRLTTQHATENLFIGGASGIIATADTLVEDAFPHQSFDVVVADGPYGMAWTTDIGIEQDERFRLGLPPQSDSSFLFLQAVLSKLRRREDGGGVGIFFTAIGPLVSPAAGLSEIRKSLTDLDVLHAIVALPERLNLAIDIRLYALVLSTARTKPWRGRTQIVDLRSRFEDDPLGPERRRLTTQAIEDLTRAVARPLPSTAARTIESSDLTYRVLKLRSTVALSSDPRRAPSLVTFGLHSSPTQDVAQLLEARYPIGQPPVVVGDTGRETRWDVDRVFGVANEVGLTKSLMAMGWSATPLAAMVTSAHYVRSESAPERAEILAALAERTALILPIEAHLVADAGDPNDNTGKHRSLILELDDRLDPHFLAAWLNSPTGRISRLVAAETLGLPRSPRAMSITDCWRLLDETLVPVPEPGAQLNMTTGQTAVAAARRRLTELESQMWQQPGTVSDVRRTATKLLDSGDLRDWAETLPYPLASSLRTVETLVRDDAAAAEQFQHFWAATATFMASYLLAAIHADEALWHGEGAQLKRTLESVHLSFDRATLGTWKVTVERLSRVFRDGLSSDEPDQAARHRLLLGNPPRSLAERLLSTDVVRLLGDAISLRNRWSGHGGTVSSRAAREQRAAWQTLTEELRDAIGSNWADFRLVRGGRMDYVSGKFNVDVEILMGPTTPFVRDQVELDRPLVAGELSMLSANGDILPLAPFVQLRSSLGDPEYTCYFYNRREGPLIRMVAYHLAAESEVTETHPEVAAYLDSIGY